uniref:Putative secreted protein n=1 Tax=Ixodes ricinus TaxID=34613 RepID=A0A6B0UMF0_IXORI
MLPELLLAFVVQAECLVVLDLHVNLVHQEGVNIALLATLGDGFELSGSVDDASADPDVFFRGHNVVTPRVRVESSVDSGEVEGTPDGRLALPEHRWHAVSHALHLGVEAPDFAPGHVHL